MRLALAALVCLACSTPPTLPAPGTWREATLPPGVLARTDLLTRTVDYSSTLGKYPPWVVVAVVLHEGCHLRGEWTEAGADCCAARLFVELYGPEHVPEIVEFWLSTSNAERAMLWMACAEVHKCLLQSCQSPE